MAGSAAGLGNAWERMTWDRRAAVLIYAAVCVMAVASVMVGAYLDWTQP